MSTKSKISDLIAHYREVEAKATPGPWSVRGGDGHILGNSIADAKAAGCAHYQWTHNTTLGNADVMAASRNLFLVLLDVVAAVDNERKARSGQSIDDAMERLHEAMEANRNG